jgi:5'-nucleotidase
MLILVDFCFNFGERTYMRTLTPLLCCFMLAVSAAAQVKERFTILHTNDLHSRLTGFAPESSYSPLSLNDDNTRGGFARIASILKNEKQRAGGIAFGIDAGDFLMGTLFTPLEPEYGFQLRLMKEMGYDIAALGNHEYDYGPGQLVRIIRLSAEKGDIPYLLAGNAGFGEENKPASDFEGLFKDGLISRKIILEREGMKFGFFSVLGDNAAEVAPNAAPVKFSDKVRAARKLVNELNSDGCDVIICISHSGITKNAKGEFSGEDFELAAGVKGIDIIIGGHSHTRLEKPLVVNGVSIVQTGEFGQNVGKAVFSYSKGIVQLESYELIPVDDRIKGDETVNGLIESQKVTAGRKILDPLGYAWDRIVAEAGFTLEGNDTGNPAESNLGPFVADAIHYYVNSKSPEGSDVSMVAAGMLFDRIVPGMQTAPDLFRVMSLGSGDDGIPGYALSRLYVSGRELKNILEILLVASKGQAQNYCYYSGIRVNYDPSRGLLRKLSRIAIIHSDGTLTDVYFSKKEKRLYSVTANSYMLQFIGIIKKSSLGLINVQPKDRNGNPVKDMKTAVIDMDPVRPGIQEGKEWIALIEYLSSLEDVNGNGIPDVPGKYSSPLSGFTAAGGK